ncbi:MAG: TIGR02206 family membrane protein [Chthoniobacteraceae bacterium]
MPGIQIGFLIFTFAGPLLLWILSRHLDSGRFSKGICWFFALSIVCAKVGTLIAVWREGNLTADYALPMHLCDWALVATAVALTLRRQICFELAYFWGLAGTAQALITPALDSTEFWRIFAFFVVHSGIPASVLWLIFDFKLRPQRGAWLRVALWSQVYLVVTLLVNSATGGNYGFLSGRPDVHSMLDLFSDTRWLYIIGIDLTALAFFFLLDLPWQIARWKGSRRSAGEGVR